MQPRHWPKLLQTLNKGANKMGLDPRFIVTSDLESYFVDKDSGAPLAAGIVTFYSDIDRTIKKPVYQITGSPPNYSYSALPNPCILSGVGTFQDASGNNIVPYYFPYEGTPSNSNGTVELYYITVENSGMVPQFTREGWPNFTSMDVPSSNEGFRNFIPNGQFLSHTDSPPIVQDSADNIDIKYYAQGGFSFRRTTGGASTFNNSFTRIDSGISGLDDFPRYAFNFVCTSFNSSDQVRDIGWQWYGINQFSSGNPPGSLPYTYFISAESGDSNTYTFDIRLIRNYGTGGSPSPQTDTSIGTFVIGPSYSTYVLNIADIPVANGTLGDNNDDYVAIMLRGPASSFNIQSTDFAFLTGTQEPSFFPVQTDADMLSRGVAGWMPIPDPDGSDLYLPLVLTPQGMTFDQSQVGQICALAYTTGFDGSIATDTNEILCDGSSYVTSAYSPLGIPYSRLGEKLFDNAAGLPIYGTGFDFSTAYSFGAIAGEIILTTNQPGAQTATIDGATPTTFTITTTATGSTAYAVYSYMNETNNTITVIGTGAGAVTAASAGSSGFTVTEIFDSALVKQIFTVSGSALPGAGSYFLFNSSAAYYVWFTINGSGADPAPGGTGILVPLISSQTITEAMGIISDVINGYQVSRIIAVAASSVTAGSYFTFHAAGTLYAVWYKVAGSGTAPSIGGVNIEVALTGTETNQDVAEATSSAINNYQFAVPNLKGVFLRGMNVGKNNIPGDPDFASRFSLNSIFSNSFNGVGSYQANQLIQHLHSYTKAGSVTQFGSASPTPNYQAGVSGADTFPVIPLSTQNTGLTGGSEIRPFNMYVNYVIKY